ncbi:hypothetical protein LINGRAHAP2_LOCUS11695, partial [Linum grandiflorum]
NAHRLEKLSLRYIYGIDRLDISASDFPSLKSLSLQADEGELRELQLSSAPLLRTFRFVGNTKLLTVVSAPNVTSVELVAISPELTRTEFHELISKFPSLESLDFDAQYISSDYYRHHDKLSISAHTLRTLTLTQDQRKFEFEIDAPNLVTLFIITDELPININYIVHETSSTCLGVVNCSVYKTSLTTDWFVELSKCLTPLATRFPHLVFKLDFGCRYMNVNKLDWSKVRSESSPLTVQHLLLGFDLRLEPTFKDDGDEARLLDGILSAFHPKTLLIAQPRQNRSLLSYINEQMERNFHRCCCGDDKCWRCEFINAEITSVIVDDISTIDKPMTSQPSINMILKMPSDLRCS